ncbi:hypothetical protein HYU14_02610 [Candidatus Woesearchaeota archaeon]|nr:hypothetical protein [Candidatus Woesearchaeota archaeon]
MVDWEKSPILNKIKSWREGRANLKDVEGEVETEMEDEEKIEAYSKSLQRYGEATLLKQTEIDNLSYEDEKLLGQMKSDLEKDLIKLRELKASFEKQLKEYQDNPAKKDLLYRLRVNKEWIESLERKVVDGLIPNMERKIKEMSSLNEQRKALESATYATLPNIFKAEAVSEQKAKEVFAAEGEVASLYDQSFSPSDTKTIINEEKKEEILDEKTKKLLEQEAKSEQEASEGENREQIKLVQQAQLLEGIKTNLESLSKANFNLPYAYISSDVDKMNRRLEQLFPKTGWFRFRGDNLKHVKEIHEKLLSLEKKGTKLSKKKDRLRDFAKNVLIDIKKKAKK